MNTPMSTLSYLIQIGLTNKMPPALHSRPSIYQGETTVKYSPCRPVQPPPHNHTTTNSSSPHNSQDGPTSKCTSNQDPSCNQYSSNSRATHGMPIRKTVRSNIEHSVSITMLQILTLTLIQHQDGHRTLGNKDHPHISSAPQYSGIPPLHTPQPPTAPSIIP